MFLHMIHEGLMFLKAMRKDRIVLNKYLPAAKLTRETTAIVSIFYGNDVLVNSNILLHQILSTSQILTTYELDQNFNYQTVWTTGTPEAVSGETVLLAQVAHFPRIADCADLRGNLKDEGRKTVSASRGRIFTTLHSCAECFESRPLPPIWEAHKVCVGNKEDRRVQQIWCQEDAVWSPVAWLFSARSEDSTNEEK